MNQLTKAKIIGYSARIGTVIIFGSTPIALRKLALDGLETQLVVGLQLLGGGIFLILFTLPFQLIGRMEYKFSQLFRSKYFWFSSVALAINLALFYTGLQYTIATDAQLIVGFMPLLMLVYATYKWRNRISYLENRNNLLKIFRYTLFGIAGIAFLVLARTESSGLEISSRAKLIGDMIILIAITFSVISLINRKEFIYDHPQHSSLVFNAFSMLIAGILFIPFIPLEGLTRLSGSQFLILFLAIVIPTAIAYVLAHVVHRYLSLMPAIITLSFSALITIILDRIFLQTKLSWPVLTGAILIICASIAADRLHSKTANPQKRIF
ncbi:hypothetical protein COT40_00480 [Candidatus Peregrinibacteria bacterium CG08_land_8_20_14_0_20_41_10]|nr:MAG: hypothetical protein COT40_00480 [Candidatus Peregrinibacteria bacterium CG08_land_8_20_14_0_20_41_10]